ncbi:hypothetical protein BC628DRAFT_530663 [Trametes gibbosa]|nr:hypothetical protein BC628DRAFT_530663 [Trametes gibbosa]
MYYPQQSPGIVHKLPTHQHPSQLHDQTPWGRHAGYGPANGVGAQPPTSPAYPLFTHGNGTMTAMQHHPHQHIPGPLAHHHHQNSLTHAHFSSPPNGNAMQGPHGTLGQAGSPGAIQTQMITPHWQQQLLKCEVCLDLITDSAGIILRRWLAAVRFAQQSTLYSPTICAHIILPFMLLPQSLSPCTDYILSDEPCFKISPPPSQSERDGRSHRS